MKNELPASNAKVIAIWALLCLIWGSTWLVIKIGLHDLPPLWFVTIRFAIAAAFLFAFCAGRYPMLPRSRRECFFLAGTGILVFTVNYGLIFWAEQHVSSGLAAVLQASTPIFGMTFAHLHLPGERMQRARIAGAVLGLAGVAVICAKVLDVQGTLALWGGLAVIIAAVSSAYSNVWTKLRGGGFAPAALAAWQMVFGLGPLLVLACWQEGDPRALHWTAAAVVCLLYLALVGSALAFFLYYWLMERVPVTKLQTIALVTPPLAVVLGWLAGGEELSVWALLGGGFILLGMGLIFSKTPARTVPVIAGAAAASDAA